MLLYYSIVKRLKPKDWNEKYMPKCPYDATTVKLTEIEGITRYYWCTTCWRAFDYEIKLTKCIGKIIPPSIKPADGTTAEVYESSEVKKLPEGIKDK
jgi:hypothetical protein